MFSINAIVKIHDYKISNDWSFEKEMTIFVLKAELKDVLGDGDTNCLHWNTDYFDYFFPKPNFAHGFDFSVLR